MTQAFSLEGNVYQALSSRRIAARIDAAPFEGSIWVRVVAENAQELACAPLADTKIGTAVGSTARRLTFNDGTLFETYDRAGFTALDTGTYHARPHALEHFGPHLIAFTAACLATAYLLWKYGLDILAALAVAVTPQVIVKKTIQARCKPLILSRLKKARLPTRK